MADPRDDRVSAAYRDLPGEGPSPSLDAAIQAAARRAVGSRPAAGRRWQKPLSIAAVFMLAIAVSLQVEREKPVGVEEAAPVSTGSAEYPVPQADTEPAAPVSKPAAPAPRQAGRNSRTGATRERSGPPGHHATDTGTRGKALRARDTYASIRTAKCACAGCRASPAAAFSAPAASGAAVSRDTARAAPQAAPRAKSELAREATTQEKRMADALDTPERRLERIAGLRSRGLHEEADRELAEFRRAFPDYRISEEWLGKVERK